MCPLRSAKLFHFRFLLWLAGLFLIIVVAARVAMWTDTGADGVAAIWWSNAILLAALLLNRRKRWTALLITGYLANVVAHWIARDPFAISIGMSACDLLETTISAYPFAKAASGAISFSRPREIARLYIVGALFSPAISTLFASALMYLLYGSLPRNFSINWFTSNALATIAITPILLSLFSRETYSIFRRPILLRSLGLLSLLAVCTALIFAQVSFPLLFLLFPPLLLVVVRLGLGGGMLGVSVITVLAVIFTAYGRGPMALVHNAVWQKQIFLTQILIASTVLCVALVAVVLNERRHLEQSARKSEQLYRLLAENSRDIIVLTDLEHRREYISPAVQWTMGWDPQELMGTTFQDSVVHPDDIPAMKCTLEALKNGEPAKTLTYRCQKKDGDYLWMEANISLYCDRVTGDPIGYVNVVRNIAERKAAEERLQDAYLELETLATVDSLTGVANRRHFDEILAQEWRRAIRSQQPLSLLLLDVDHFKLYNDLYGHLRGDGCLRQIAESTLDVIQRPGDTVARFGGEEFGIILADTNGEAAEKLAETIRQAVAGRRLDHRANPPGVITVSIGCATCIPARGSHSDSLIDSADQALYRAKRGGRNRVITSTCCPSAETAQQRVEDASTNQV